MPYLCYQIQLASTKILNNKFKFTKYEGFHPILLYAIYV